MRDRSLYCRCYLPQSAGRQNQTEWQGEMKLDDVLSTAVELGLKDIEAIRRLARPAVVMKTREDSESISPLSSRIGGLPVLPRFGAWPRQARGRLAFIAQINLGEIPRGVAEDGLPDSGLLLFFYDAEQQTWGYDPADQGSFAVLYFSEVGDVTPSTEWPSDIPEEARFAPLKLEFDETIALPPWGSVLVEDLAWEEAQLDRYMDLQEMITKEDAWPSRRSSGPDSGRHVTGMRARFGGLVLR